MKYRIALWGSAGFLVAGFWALFAFATFPATNERLRDLWALVSLTCPVAIAGRHYPISLYEALAANAVTYALVGLIVETLRHQLHHAKWFKSSKQPTTSRNRVNGCYDLLSTVWSEGAANRRVLHDTRPSLHFVGGDVAACRALIGWGGSR